MGDVPGFLDYYAFDAGDGVMVSVNAFTDRSGLDEAERRLGQWIEQTTSDFDISPGAVSEGVVFATTRPAA